MKIFLLIIVLCCVAYIGWQIKTSLKKKKVFYEDLVNFCEDYKREVTFLKCGLDTIIDKCTKHDSAINKVLTQYLKNGTCEINDLRHEDVNDIKVFLAGLGKQDVDGEVNNIEFHKSKFVAKLHEHEKIYDKYGSFSVKMSALVGVLICIILI